MDLTDMEYDELTMGCEQMDALLNQVIRAARDELVEWEEDAQDEDEGNGFTDEEDEIEVDEQGKMGTVLGQGHPNIGKLHDPGGGVHDVLANVPLIRRFPKNACVCCMGGSCYVLGHVGSCTCVGYLLDLKTGKIKGRYGFDALKVYVPREEDEESTVNVVDLCVGLARMCQGWYVSRRGVDVAAW